MKTNALAAANYFVELAKRDGVDLSLLALLKLVYITHGFTLAIFNKPAIDHRFDAVEAWKLGPVIPSVYHSFKHNGRGPITEPTIIVRLDGDNLITETPRLHDKDIKWVADDVWGRYKHYTGSQLVELLHREGTPWRFTYRADKNYEIPDTLTKAFYSKYVVVK